MRFCRCSKFILALNSSSGCNDSIGLAKERGLLEGLFFLKEVGKSEARGKNVASLC